MTNNDSLLPVGTLLDEGKYRVERILGSGGFGNTYLAKDLRMDVPCVIKEFFLRGINVRNNNNVTVSVPENRQTFDDQLRKFKKEAQRLFKIINYHIVRVHTFFDENSTSYYVMDYIDGQSLSSLLKQQQHPMSEQQVRDILHQVLDALKTVHGQSEPLYHLDIKPGNIMLDKKGRVTLIDFGASKQFSSDGGLTSTSTAMSYTPGYAPLEQVEQDMESIGPWTDFFALGATAYTLLTTNRPPSIGALNRPNAFVFPASVSNELQKLIIWMMAPFPKDRPQNVDEILNALSKNTPIPEKHSEEMVVSSGQPSTSEETVVASEPSSEETAVASGQISTSEETVMTSGQTLEETSLDSNDRVQQPKSDKPKPQVVNDNKLDTPSNVIEDTLLPQKWPWSLTTIYTLLSLVCFVGTGIAMFYYIGDGYGQMAILAFLYMVVCIYSSTSLITANFVSSDYISKHKITPKKKDKLFKAFLLISFVFIFAHLLLFFKSLIIQQLLYILLFFQILICTLLLIIRTLRKDHDVKYPNNRISIQLKSYFYIFTGLLIITGLFALWIVVRDWRIAHIVLPKIRQVIH